MERRLTAILAADVVGYSALMEADAEATLDALRLLRDELFGPTVAGHRGKVAKSMGDGWLVEFSSAVDAVSCALQIQDGLADHQEIALRMGIHIGDVVHTDEDVFGDGVNIAARLEALAEPGAVVVSDAVFGSLDGTLRPSFDDLGPQELKNLDRPVRAWLRGGSGAQPKPSGSGKAASGLPRLDVAPIRTLDTRGEITELADALTSDLATFLGSVRWLDADTRAPSDGAFALQANLRVRGERLRLEARLTAPGGAQIWTDKYDGTLADSFDWQDETAEAISAEVMDTILDTETRRLAEIPPEARDAQQCLLQGLMSFRMAAEQSFVDANAAFSLAIEKDPQIADAYAEAILVTYAGLTVGHDRSLAPYAARIPEWVEASAPLRGRSVSLDLARALAIFRENAEAGGLRRAVAEALRRAPLDAHVLAFGGWSLIWAGAPEEALECFARFQRFGRFHPFAVAALGGYAMSALQTADDATAIEYANRGLRLSHSYATLYSVKAAAHALRGEETEAAEAMAAYRALMPTRTLSNWLDVKRYADHPGSLRYLEGLRLAGLPEE